MHAIHSPSGSMMDLPPPTTATSRGGGQQQYAAAVAAVDAEDFDLAGSVSFEQPVIHTASTVFSPRRLQQLQQQQQRW